MGFSFVWILSITIPSIIGGVNTSLLFYILKFYIMFLIVSIMHSCKINYLKILYNFMKVFLVWGFFNYIITVTNFSLLPVTAQYPTWWGGSYDLYLYVFFKNTQGIFEVLGMNIQRLHSPFSEPGVAQFFFNFGLFYALFYSKESRGKKCLWILLFTIIVLLTTSLTGISILLFIYCIYLLKNKRYFLFTFFCVGAFIISFIMISQKINTISYDDRTSDFLFIFSSAKENMPFGVGIGNSELAGTRIDVVTGKDVSGGFFSGLFSPLVYFGMFSIVFYWLLIISIKNFDKNKYKRLCFGLLIVITLLTEPLTLTTIMALFFSNGIVNMNNNVYFNCIKIRNGET